MSTEWTEAATAGPSGAPPLSPWRWSWYLPGIVAVGWGAYGLLSDAQGPATLSWLVFVGTIIVAHDFVLSPLAVVVGWLIARRAPGFLRAPLQVGLAGSTVFLLAGVAYISGRGTSADVPSALPFDYAARVAVLCALWWAAMAVWAAFRVVRGRQGAPLPAPAQTG